MARARRGLAAAALLAFALAHPAPAQALRALHVDALGMRADHTSLHVGEVFHLAIHVHVREAVTALDELVVPDVGTMQLEGDERHVSTAPSGTDVVETLTLEPTQRGAFTFNGAYLDAIDARTRKPSRFSSNPVRVVVEAPAGEPNGLFYESPGVLIRRLAVIAFVAVTALAVAVGVILPLAVRRRRARAPEAPVITQLVAPPPPARTPRDDVADALRTYRTSPGTSSLMQLRGALFVAAGADAGSTLRDALAATADGALRDALVAAERTAFGPAHLRDASSAELVDAVEGWLR